MTPRNNDYSEESLVERPAIELFDRLKWSTQNCFHEFDERGSNTSCARRNSQKGLRTSILLVSIYFGWGVKYIPKGINVFQKGFWLRPYAV